MIMNFIIDSIIGIISVLLSGLLAGLVVQYFIRIFKQFDKAKKTANYAKLLAYECSNNHSNYNIIAKNLHEVKKDVIFVKNKNTLVDKWRSILQYDISKSNDNQLIFAIPAILEKDDIIFWMKNKERFIHLPTNDFETLHRYFSVTRSSAEALLSSSNISNCEWVSTICTKAADYSCLVNLYLSYLIFESERPLYAYILKSKYKNPYYEAYVNYFKKLKKDVKTIKTI